MNPKKPLSFWQIWNMSFGFFGIQFGWGLQMGNMSAIYQFLGADESSIPILWLAAPLTGFILQPIIGYFSDRTWTRLGRRRPYFLVGAVLASLALVAMPNSSALWMAAGLLWILDASVNVSMEPFRAFVGDKLPPHQRKVGFAMQSLLIGAGAVIASALPFILKNGFGVSGEATATSAIPPSVHLAFYIGAGVFFAAVLYTILSTREDPPEDPVAFERMKREHAGVGHAFKEIFQGIGQMPNQMVRLAVVQFFTWFALFCMWMYFGPGTGKKVFHGQPLGTNNPTVEQALAAPAQRALIERAAGVANSYDALKNEIAKANPPSTKAGDVVMRMFGLKADPDPAEKITRDQWARLVAEGFAPGKAGALDDDKLAEMRANPLVRTIAASALDHGGITPDPAAMAADLEPQLAAARLYQAGSAWAGVCFAVYNLVAFLFSFLLLGLTKKFSAKKIHLVCLTIGALGLIGSGFVSSAAMLPVCMVGVGVAWASILSMPYAMLANAIPASRMGFFMGVFNFFITIPQMLASVGLGPVVRSLLGGNAMHAVVLGGVSMLVAAASVTIVRDTESAAP